MLVLVLNFSTEFLEGWGSSVENARRFTEAHAYRNGNKRLIHISPHISLTGAKSDRWIQIKPGTEGLVALSVAYVIREEKDNYVFLKLILNPIHLKKLLRLQESLQKK